MIDLRQLKHSIWILFFSLWLTNLCAEPSSNDNTCKNRVGLIGVGVMGKGLARNAQRNGFTVVLRDAFAKDLPEFAKTYGADGSLVPVTDLKGLVAALPRPRKIMMIIPTGKPVDDVIAEIAPLLEAGDILIDNGNSHFTDTIQREKMLKEKGIRFMGIGLSGGEKGALEGPSLMPGGDYEAFKEVQPFLEAIAAKASDGKPMVTWIGPNGAGHYAKSLHNGIEYAELELIAEVYDVLKRKLNLTPEEFSSIFAEWNSGELNSYLLGATKTIVSTYDPETKKPILDVILDRAKELGTGRETAESSLELRAPLPTTTMAVIQRHMAEKKDLRIKLSALLAGPDLTNLKPVSTQRKKQIIQWAKNALYASKIISFVQGLELMKAASDHYHWSVDMRALAGIWRAGCILQSQLLYRITEAYQRNPNLQNLLEDSKFQAALTATQKDLRKFLKLAIETGTPAPALGASLNYYDSIRTANLSMNLVAALRDYFGSHNYWRNDKSITPEQEKAARPPFHTLWDKSGN